MTPLEELHARMDNRSRKHARPSRAWWAMGRHCNLHGPHLNTDICPDCREHALASMPKPPAAPDAHLSTHELYTPRDDIAKVLLMWEKASRLGHKYSFKDTNDQTHLLVVCTDDDWVALQGEGRGE